jgi:hypothetical protein
MAYRELMRLNGDAATSGAAVRQWTAGMQGADTLSANVE